FSNSPYLSHYAQASNRLAAGEQTVIVMSSRVAQKSYGNEKRFLCPPPTAVLLGHSWYTGDPSRNSSEHGSPSSSHSSPHQHAQHPHLAPSQHALATQVLISISGETNTSDGTLEWSTPAGKPIDPTEDVFGDEAPPARIGRCVGKQLYISDVDERKKRVEALVKISVTAQHGDRIEEHHLGTFTSKPIKVISKPSKKRQSAKNLELCINHGSTVSLFHRLRSQTVSTKYLCVSGSGASFKGSDGTPLPGLDPRQRSHAPSFVAKTASWDMFIIYIVDVTKPSSGPDTIVPPPFQPDYPPPPPNAIACSADNVTTPIYYNQTVVLQCLTSGVVSPVLIIRKVEQGTVIVGGGLADSSKGVPDHYCLAGEVCGDPVSQLHKIAFEVYEPAHSTPPELGTPGSSGAFLSCMGEKVNTYRPVDVRQWPGNPMMMIKQPSPEASPYFPPPHSVMMQNSQSSPGVYNGMGSGQPSPSVEGAFEFGLDAAGAARSIRRKRGSLSTAGAPSLPNLKTTPARGRKRGDSVASMASSRSGPGTPGVTTFGEAASNAISGALWSIDVGETAVWTIVGTDQVRYNFYIPPTVVDGRSVHLLGGHNGTGHHVQPIVPSPMVHKCSATDGGAVLSLHGESFRKEDPPQIYFGTEPSPVVEVRSPELIVCRVPVSVRDSGSQQRWPIVLIRGDGVVYPTSFSYP
ncbi:LAG1-DNAbind-domain-containing protein, partial [Clavulina sp. PMI_390]